MLIITDVIIIIIIMNYIHMVIGYILLSIYIIYNSSNLILNILFNKILRNPKLINNILPGMSNH